MEEKRGLHRHPLFWPFLIFFIFLIGQWVYFFVKRNALEIDNFIKLVDVPGGYTVIGSIFGVILGLSSKYLYDVSTLEKEGKRKTETVSGDTQNRINKAVEAFPVKYPDYKTRPPKLDADVRSWLKESGIAQSDREAHVFGSIISEHYKLSPDK